MRKRFTVALLGLLSTLGLLVATSGTAQANDAAYSKIVNQSTYTITGGFMTYSTAQGWHVIPLNIQTGSDQGEYPGNKSYEPRNLHIPSKWCMIWHFKVWGKPAGSDNRDCAPSNVYPGIRVVGIYFGDGNTESYDVVVTGMIAPST